MVFWKETHLASKNCSVFNELFFHWFAIPTDAFNGISTLLSSKHATKTYYSYSKSPSNASSQASTTELTAHPTHVHLLSIFTFYNWIGESLLYE